MDTLTPGRPRVQETVDDIVASVLATAGPRVGTPAYSTRSIAELTGLSQTLVSRAVRRIRRPGSIMAAASGPPLAAGSSADPKIPALQLAEFGVEFPQITLRFEPADADPALRPRVFERRAAAVMAALWVSGAASWPSAAGVSRNTWTETVERPIEDPGVPTVSAHQFLVHWNPAACRWETFLAQVAGMLDHCVTSPEAIPAGLLRLLASRVGHALHGVRWARGSAEAPETSSHFDSERVTVAEFPSPGRSEHNRWLPRVELSATEQIAVALRKEMTDSGFAPGGRISASGMAQRLGLDPSTVRTAMRQLADDGLLARSDRGFRLPLLTGADVIDLYASRLHVGMVILRACAAQPKHRLLPARLALGSLEAVAARGSRVDSGEADLRFQQELAEASGLPQSARSFHALTLRVRMFISVLQLDYSPAADRLVSDNRRILTAVLEGRAGEAVRIWRSKQDNAVRHMSALAPDTFDAALWDRLAH
ncbi:GntR family transcriptional regulator [Nesterenkonia muleiensis]|uniref:GntR family transcriptional regulator n=1 Tax=Nesterenkonia muleiensis TaxID=2282648 RepID=UPI000E73B228|nr:GntR family transcriptional regulator [Nesterenkonia muleiensis]